MRTAKEIMEKAFKEGLEIVTENSIADVRNDSGASHIAASNLAIAIFSYEVEMEAMRNSQQSADEDFSTEGEDNG